MHLKLETGKDFRSIDTIYRKISNIEKSKIFSIRYIEKHRISKNPKFFRYDISKNIEYRKIQNFFDTIYRKTSNIEKSKIFSIRYIEKYRVDISIIIDDISYRPVST
jgi:hypothetical protein